MILQNKKTVLSLILFCLLSTMINLDIHAQDVYSASRASWMEKAEQLKPALQEIIIHPVQVVSLVADVNAFQGWTVNKSGTISDFYQTSFRKQNSVVLDLGDHYTGYFSFTIKPTTGTPDAPMKFKLTFGEVPSEIATPFDPYKGGLSRAWLQDEMITVMDIPYTATISRRLACRYVKIDLIGSSTNHDFVISDVSFKTQTSAKNIPVALSQKTDPLIKSIDSVGLNTLKECMQTVYEDGPKRDRRLWIGDLYLESLANSYSFKNHELTKRCLLLLAGLSDEDGKLVGTVFETPTPHPQAGQHLLDYSLLYNAALKEYLVQTNDLETAGSLWPVAKKQIEIVKSLIQKDGMMEYERANKEWWLFFDWKDGLNKQAALQGIVIYSLQQTYDLAKLLKKEKELKEVPELITLMKKAAMQHLYDQKTGLFVSGNDRQLSYASQIWMVLAGVPNEKQSKKALLSISSNQNALTPGGPYLYHYYIDALIKSGLNKEAKSAVLTYWGGMVKKGADTFWEVYDPKNEFLSPYNFFPINSYCHAWSCTPVYFIRKYPQIFQ